VSHIDAGGASQCWTSDGWITQEKIHQHNFGKKNVASTEQLKRYMTMAKCADSTGAMGARQREGYMN